VTFRTEQDDGNLDILPAMDGRDCHCCLGGNKLRFAFHGPGQPHPVCTRCHAQPGQCFLPALKDRVCAPDHR
jgi:hypothetical protein